MLNKRSILLCILLGAITLALYWPARSFSFIDYDDNEYITLNQHVQAGLTWDGIVWAFQGGYASNWHPLTWISHMVDCQLYGLNAGGHHFTNILLHAFNAMLLFLVLLRMTGTTWRSCIVAALFAWHPAHVESVAWIAERKDVLSTFFGLLTMLAYACYVREPRNKNSSTIYYCLALVCFALSLLAKPMLVTLPFVLLLLDHWPLKRIGECGVRSAESGKAEEPTASKLGIRALVMEKLPFFGLVAISCMLTLSAQQAGGATKGNGMIPLSWRIEHALVVYVKYVKMMIWPTRLAFFYPHTGAPPTIHTLIALAVLVVFTMVALQWVRDAAYFPVGWFWYLGTLVPVIGILQVGNQAMADRYTYFPFIGLSIAIVWGASQLWEKWKPWRLALNVGVVAVLVACLVATSKQLQYWQNSYTLADHATKVVGSNFVAYGVMSEYLEQQGKYEEAIGCATTSLKYMPTYAPALYFLGIAYLETGRFKDASATLSEAARQLPNSPMIYQKWGRALVAQGRYDDAFEQFSTALRLNRADSVSESQIGIICSQKQDFYGAIQHYRAALALVPNAIEALNNLAWIRAANANADFRNGVEAVELAKRACDATGNKEPVLLGTLAAAYAEAGDFTNAVATASKARDLALSKNDKATAKNNEKLLKLYRENRPYHEGSENPGSK